MAVGLIDEWAQAERLSSIEATFEPDPVRHERALEGHARFIDAYERMRGWFR
jgi:hypothetical protein